MPLTIYSVVEREERLSTNWRPLLRVCEVFSVFILFRYILCLKGVVRLSGGLLLKFQLQETMFYLRNSNIVIFIFDDFEKRSVFNLVKLSSVKYF